MISCARAAALLLLLTRGCRAMFLTGTTNGRFSRRHRGFESLSRSRSAMDLNVRYGTMELPPPMSEPVSLVVQKIDGLQEDHEFFVDEEGNRLRKIPPHNPTPEPVASSPIATSPFFSPPPAVDSVASMIISKLNGDIRQLEDDVRGLKHQASRDVESLQEKYEQLLSSRDLEIAKLHTELDELNEIKQILRSQIVEIKQNHQEEVDRLKFDYGELQKQNIRLKESLSQKEHDLKESSRKHADLQDELKEAKGQKEDLEKHVEQLKEENEGVQEVLEATRESNDELAEQNNQLSERVTENLKTITELGQELYRLQVAAHILRASLTKRTTKEYMVRLDEKMKRRSGQTTPAEPKKAESKIGRSQSMSDFDRTKRKREKDEQFCQPREGGVEMPQGDEATWMQWMDFWVIARAKL